MEIFKMVERAGHPAFATDERDRILATNIAAEELLGALRDDMVGGVFHETLVLHDVFGNRLCTSHAFNEMVRRGDPIHAFDVDVHRACGASVRVKTSVVVVLGPQPGCHHFVYHLIPRRRRRKSDEVIDFLLKTHGGLSLPESPTSSYGEEVRLTRREREVLRRMVDGESTREMSRALDISPNTLRSHTQRILRKLGVHSRVEAVALALKHDIV